MPPRDAYFFATRFVRSLTPFNGARLRARGFSGGNLVHGVLARVNEVYFLPRRFVSGSIAWEFRRNPSIRSNNPNRVLMQNWVGRNKRQTLAQRLCDQDAVKRIAV